VGTFRFSHWEVRLARDVIVPTFPVREGEVDTVVAARLKLVSEQKARLPETLKRPLLRCGIIFKFAAGAKVQRLQWVPASEAETTTVIKDSKAELGWNAAVSPRSCEFTVVFADGAEAARVSFDAQGRATVALRHELRAALWLGARYSPNDDARANGLPRYAWQVVRGSLASSAWFNDGNWSEGAGCRLDVVLNGALPAGTVIALVDHISDWMLSTELE
jgi:hypothetical protein